LLTGRLRLLRRLRQLHQLRLRGLRRRC